MRLFLLSFPFLLITVLSPCLFAQKLAWHPQQAETQASLRGLHVVNDTVVWVSGAKGTLLRTLDGGKHWQQLTAPDSLDFRSLWAFNDQEALIASAGQPACLYRTADGGKSWQLILKDSTGEAFFDAINFWDSQRGLLLSDPIDGRILLLKTTNGGINWLPVETPAPYPGEAFFAASNGSIAMAGNSHAWIGSGGSAIRVLTTADAGNTWYSQAVPMPLFSQAAGIYALAFADKKRGIAVGGAYDNATSGAYAAYYTRNGGKSWQQSLQPPSGYRSGLAQLPGSSLFVAVGTNGTDLSSDAGKRWKKINAHTLNSIRFSPTAKRGWAIGPKGTIFLLEVQP